MNRRIVLPTCSAITLAVSVWTLNAVDNATLKDWIAVLPAPPATDRHPTDAEIFHCRVFPEPLVPIGGQTTPQENAALLVAINLEKNRAEPDDHSAILAFLEQNPHSVWRAALFTNLGLEYRRTGWFLKALDAWEQAWAIGRNEKSPMGKPLIDRAVGELAELNARLGRRERAEAILKEIEGRPLIGPATEKVTAAREGVWMMRNEPGNSFKCGPLALGRIRASRNPSTEPDPKIIAAQSTDHGMSLDQVWKLSQDLGMNYQMAKRAPGSEVIVPSVVNWKANHYAALLRVDHGRYLIEDPTFGDPIRVTKTALDAESTGYFLIPPGELPRGWQRVGVEEARQVWGMGNTGDHDATGTKAIDVKAKPICKIRAMADYNFHLQTVSLNIADTPIGYTPPRGPDMLFTITYNQRELSPTINHSHSNFGSKWLCNWIAWVDGDPTVPPTDAVRIFLPNGGSELHTVSSGTFSTDPQSGAALTVFPDPNTGRFERTLPDGSKEVFQKRDYIPFYHSNSVYLAKLVDPAGNATQFSYDNNFRLVSATDALNRTTTIFHLSDDPAVLPDYYLIARITDPFGRSATFDYQNGQLVAIHDTMGITSRFTYAAGTDFIDSMTTPYDTTTFSQPPSVLDATSGSGTGNARTIQAVSSKTGAVERVEYGHLATDNTAVPATESTLPTVPGVNIYNGVYNYRNSFYWDRKATAMYPPTYDSGCNCDVYDFTKAKLVHWLHVNDGYGGTVSNIIEREKLPLENSVYYFYANQPNTYNGTVFTGSNGWPTKVARVLDDGTTQLWQYDYNAVGKLTQSIDPAGRVTTYDYDTNNVDLLRVRQTTANNNELLRSFTYNSQHEPLTDKDASGQSTSFTYNATGQVLTQKNAKNETTTYAYGDGSSGHPLGYLTSITSPVFNGSSAVTSFTYDGTNRVRTITDSDNYTITNDYDNLDRLTQVTYPDGTNRQLQYTQDFGQGPVNIPELTRTKDRRNLWTVRHYNSNRQIDSVTDPLNRTTQFGWCSCGALTSITDARGKLTTFNRDLQSRLTSKLFADGTSTSYAYENTTSRLKSLTDAKNQVTNYLYYPDDNLQQITYTDTTGHALNPPTPSVLFTYDPIYNRLITMTDGTGPTTYSYKPVAVPPSLGAGQLASIDGPLANDTISFAYDELGRVINRSINGSSNSVNWTFDSLGRTSATTNKLGTFTYSYVNLTDRLSKLAYPNGLTANYLYFPNLQDKRLQEIKNLASKQKLVSQFDYTYDPEGEILTWTKNNPSLSPTPQRFTLGYDNADQLLTAALRDTTRKNTLIKQYNYAYDVGGNRTSEQIGSVTTTSLPNDVNEIVSQSGGTNRALSYDLNGNLISDGSSRSFEWDAANRLVAVNYTGTANRSEFSYDGLSRCAKIVEKTNGSITSTRKFVWSGMERCEYRDANDAVTLFLYPQGQQAGATPYFYSRDHLGSIREMTNSSGTVVARFEYDPYGRSTSVISTTLPDLNFTGLYRHAASNLDLAVFRAYDPDLGRWLNRDPLGEKSGTNPYDYVTNNVVNAVDPGGLVTFFVHGTFGQRVESFSKNFYHHVMDYYGDPNARFFDWSGQNSDSARQQAAADLAIQIRHYRKDHPCEEVRVVAHSHGGNVALLASQYQGAYIDELVTLGTPILADYRPSNAIGNWINVFSYDDWVQLRAFPYNSAQAFSAEATNNIELLGFGHTQLHSVAAWDTAFPPR